MTEQKLEELPDAEAAKNNALQALREEGELHRGYTDWFRPIRYPGQENRSVCDIETGKQLVQDGLAVREDRVLKPVLQEQKARG